jgi:hypothetical protein
MIAQDACIRCGIRVRNIERLNHEEHAEHEESNASASVVFEFPPSCAGVDARFYWRLKKAGDVRRTRRLKAASRAGLTARSTGGGTASYMS